ncbi:MAG: novN [Bacteroidetes bacterium]|nr:novN [Bacteroidota bacterium]
MKILGISAYYHDSAAALTIDGRIIAAVQEERFTRVKHDDSFPANAVKYCLEYSGLTIDQLDAVVFYDKPFIKFERLIETYYAYAPQGILSFLKAMPVWMREKLFLRSIIKDELEHVMDYDRKKVKVLFPEHHLSHAASAFYPSPYHDAAILTIDGVGEWATASISHGQGSSITVKKELHFPDSVGLLYSAFTYFLGFKVNSGEYKLMGLAPYGIAGSEQVERFKKIITDKLVAVMPDGSVQLDQSYFNYAVGLRMAKDGKWEKLFGFKKRKEEDALTQAHCDLALAIQQVTEGIVLKMAAEAKRLTGADNLCLAGGVALNCVANGKLLREGTFKNIWIQPAAGDAGGALGAALAAEYIFFGAERKTDEVHDTMHGSYLGPEYGDDDITKTITQYKAVSTHYEDESRLCDSVAELIEKGMVVGWYQGRAEFGPRALGNRTILADPRNTSMQQKLNLKIKYREGFRPFAPSVMIEDVANYFELDRESPYMLLVADVQKSIRKEVPVGYHTKPMMERLYVERSSLPSITHVDFSARIQTVSRETNPLYHRLLSSFKKKTGCGVLVNTSFNVRGEPPVLTPDDAFLCFINTEMDVLVMGQYVFLKSEQPEWKKKVRKKEFNLD